MDLKVPFSSIGLTCNSYLLNECGVHMLLKNSRSATSVKWLFLLITFGFSCLASEPSLRRVNLTTDLDVIESRLRATVAFVDPETERIFCSGFFISSNRLISAAHCFSPTASLTLPNGNTIEVPTNIDPTGSTVFFVRFGGLDMITNRLLRVPERALIVYCANGDDLVLLETEGTTIASDILRFSEERPRVGAPAFGIGHPYRLAWSFETGIISRIIRSPGSDRILLLQASVPVASGNSGGPLLDSEGNLIGMAMAYVDRLPHLAIFISAEQIQSQLRAYMAAQMTANHQ